MDESVMSILQMLQDGKISAQEAENLIAALRGGTAATATETSKPAAESTANESTDKKKIDIKIDLDSLGERISKAVARVQPERIVKRMQNQLRNATKAGASWSSVMSAKVKAWAETGLERPANTMGLPLHEESHTQEFHLDNSAQVIVENPLGDVIVVGVDEGPASVSVRKAAWAATPEQAVALASLMEVNIHGTDGRLDLKVSAPDPFQNGTVDLELKIPRSVAQARLKTTFGVLKATNIEGTVDANSSSGSVTLSEIGSEVRVESASGSVSVENVNGVVALASTSGDIHAANLSKGLRAGSASGDIHISGLEGGSAECKSVSGDVLMEKAGLENPLDIVLESISGDLILTDAVGNLALKTISGDMQCSQLMPTRLQAQTVSGDITLKLKDPYSSSMQVSTVSGDVNAMVPEGSNMRVSLSTASGELRCEHDASEVTATDTLWCGNLGTGAGTMNVQTISGDVHLLRASTGVE